MYCPTQYMSRGRRRMAKTAAVSPEHMPPLSSASERCSKRDAVYVLYKGYKQGALYAVQNSMRNGSPEPSEGPHTPSSVSAKWVPG
jgi:hypothetical protein